MIRKMYTEGTYLIVTDSGKFIGVYLDDDEIAIAMSAGIIGCDELAEVANRVLKNDYREMTSEEFDFSENCNVLTIKFLEKMKKGSLRRLVSKEHILSGRAGIKIDISQASARFWDARMITPDGEYNELQFYSHGRTWSILASFSSLMPDDYHDIDCDRLGQNKRMEAVAVSSEELKRGMQSLVPYVWKMVDLLIGADKIVALSMTPAIEECKVELSEEVDRHNVNGLKRMIEHRLEDGCSWHMDTRRMDGTRYYVKISDMRVIYAEYHLKTNYFTQTLWPAGKSLFEIIGA